MGSHESEILYFDCDYWLMTGTKVILFSKTAFGVDIGKYIKMSLVSVRLQRIFKFGHMNGFGQSVSFS